MRQSALYKSMTLFQACGMVEGFMPCKNRQQELTAWQWLADTRSYLGLQGWYGRTIADLVDRGIIDSPRPMPPSLRPASKARHTQPA